MEIAVFLEPVDSQGFRATSFMPTRLVVEAPTREEALTQLRKLVQSQFSQGEYLRMEVPLPGEQEHPWLSMAGMWKDNPDMEEFLENMREYRRQVDADPDRL